MICFNFPVQITLEINSNPGDQYLLFTDNQFFPNYFIWVIISGGQRAYSSILKNPLDIGINIFSIKYFVDNAAQYGESIKYIFNALGQKYKENSIDPLAWRSVNDELTEEVDIRIDYNLNNYGGFIFNMLYASDTINLIFRYKK